MSDDSPGGYGGYYCEAHHSFVMADEWVAHILTDTGSPEAALVRAVQELIEAGNAIRCYPSGAVGFGEWSDAMEMAELLLRRFLDEEGNWHPMDSPLAG